MSLRLTEKTVFEILSEAAEVIRAKPEHYLGMRDFPLEGSQGTSTHHISVTTRLDDGKISLALQNGGPYCLGKIGMPVGNFPGTAESFLRDITIPDPDALPPPLSIHSVGFPTGRCRSAQDGGIT